MSDKLRKVLMTEEAYRVSSMAAERAEEWGELSMCAGMDAYMSYFCDEKMGLLDYFDADNTLIFFDELSRCVDRGQQTEREYTECMKLRLALGFVLPGQMGELITHKEILGKLSKYSCVSVGALDSKSNGLNQTNKYGIHVQSVNSYKKSFEL